MPRVLTFAFLLCSSFSLANERMDIESSIPLRTQQYPLERYNKICVISPYRTGSTLLFNIFQFLFEDLFTIENMPLSSSNRLVTKSHDFSVRDLKNIVIVPIRDPLSACFSHYRVECSKKRLTTSRIDKDLIKTTVRTYHQHLQRIDILKKNHPHVVIFKYEDFTENFEYLFDTIESILQITIDRNDRQLMTRIFSKENVLRNTLEFEDFSKWSRSTKFHGDHIDCGELSPHKKIIQQQLLQELEVYMPFFEQWGYDLQKSWQEVDSLE